MVNAIARVEHSMNIAGAAISTTTARSTPETFVDGLDDPAISQASVRRFAPGGAVKKDKTFFFGNYEV